jgi:hypothetical protein
MRGRRSPWPPWRGEHSAQWDAIRGACRPLRVTHSWQRCAPPAREGSEPGLGRPTLMPLRKVRCGRGIGEEFKFKRVARRVREWNPRRGWRCQRDGSQHDAVTVCLKYAVSSERTEDFRRRRLSAPSPASLSSRELPMCARHSWLGRARGAVRRPPSTPAARPTHRQSYREERPSEPPLDATRVTPRRAWARWWAHHQTISGPAAHRENTASAALHVRRVGKSVAGI